MEINPDILRTLQKQRRRTTEEHEKGAERESDDSRGGGYTPAWAPHASPSAAIWPHSLAPPWRPTCGGRSPGDSPARAVRAVSHGGPARGPGGRTEPFEHPYDKRENLQTAFISLFSCF